MKWCQMKPKSWIHTRCIAEPRRRKRIEQLITELVNQHDITRSMTDGVEDVIDFAALSSLLRWACYSSAATFSHPFVHMTHDSVLAHNLLLSILTYLQTSIQPEDWRGWFSYPWLIAGSHLEARHCHNSKLPFISWSPPLIGLESHPSMFPKWLLIRHSLPQKKKHRHSFALC